MRRFILENDEGDWLFLWSREFFVSNPGGLGYADNVEFSAAEFGFFNTSSIAAAQPNIVFDLLIKQGKYETYSQFVDWLQRAGSLKLICRQSRFKKLYVDVVVESVGMSELTKMGTIEIPISLKGTSPYYTVREEYFVFKPAERVEKPMRFAFGFPFKYMRGRAGDTITIEAEGHLPAAVELVAEGPLSKPVLEARNVNGQLVGVFDASRISLREGETLHYSSRPNASGAWKVSGSERIDIVGELDIGKKNFFTLPADEEITMCFSADITAPCDKALRHTLRIYEYVRG